MIILDTNVVSELMRSAPEPHVLHWLGSHAAEDLHVSAVTVGEILYGIELIVAARRRDVVRAAAEKMFETVFSDRILTFEDRAARAFSQIASSRRRQGKPMSEFDAQIAAITRVHAATLATRNPFVFEACGIRLVNPWQQGS